MSRANRKEGERLAWRALKKTAVGNSPEERWSGALPRGRMPMPKGETKYIVPKCNDPYSTK